MYKNITKPLLISKELKQKTDFICKFASVKYELIPENIISITDTNIGHVRPHILKVKENDFPFTISFNMTSNTIAPENGVATYTVSISWPYESGNDEADTLWGTRAYDFRKSNPGEACISLKVKIYITQASS